MARELAGLLVDPVDGPYPGVLTLADGVIAGVERQADAPRDVLVFPGFVDLQVYETAGLAEHGVTGYLLATRDAGAPLGPRCLGLHLEGPFLNPEAAGAIPVEEITPVDLAALDGWLAGGAVRMVTVAPEIEGGLDAIETIAAAGAVASVGHTRANNATTRAAIDAGARFATHVWNAMGPTRARATGPVPELLLNPAVTLGLIPDGRHLHPRIEELTFRVAGAERIALTSDAVVPPAEKPDGSLLGGDCCGARLVARMARFGLREAAAMASLTPARVLGLADRGRLAPGYRADLAVLAADFAPLETLSGGETISAARYAAGEELGRDSS